MYNQVAAQLALNMGFLAHVTSYVRAQPTLVLLHAVTHCIEYRELD